MVAGGPSTSSPFLGNAEVHGIAYTWLHCVRKPNTALRSLGHCGWFRWDRGRKQEPSAHGWGVASSGLMAATSLALSLFILYSGFPKHSGLPPSSWPLCLMWLSPDSFLSSSDTTVIQQVKHGTKSPMQCEWVPSNLQVSNGRYQVSLNHSCVSHPYLLSSASWEGPDFLFLVSPTPASQLWIS